MSGMKFAFVFLALMGVSTMAFELTHGSNICRAAGVNSNTAMLPHETSCNKFYKCDHGKPVLFDCPANLEWNNIEKICDWPWKAQCRAVTPCIPKPNPVCPEHNPAKPTVHLANPKDCGSFYKCSWGKLYLIPCPTGLHYNSALEVCDYPDRANCACQLSPFI